MGKGSKIAPSLSEEDKLLIHEIFDTEVVPRLKKLGARKGTISCGFAGKRFEPWNIIFASTGDGFQVLGFEYDERAREIEFPVK